MSGVILNYFVPDKAFQYMMAAVTFIGLMVWIAILITQIQFRRSLSKSQVAELAYRAPWWPYSSWFALAFIALVVVLMGFHEDARIALIVGPCLLGVYLVMFYVHYWTPLGRRIYALGGNIVASRLAGIRTRLYMVLTYVMCSTIVAFGGILLTARVGTGEATLASTHVLESITAVVIGGASAASAMSCWVLSSSRS